jgi:lactase-phlorizin hydrolase
VVYDTVFQAVPWSFRKQLNWIAREYNNPLVFVTESGFSDYGGLNDTDRVRYYAVSTDFAFSI